MLLRKLIVIFSMLILCMGLSACSSDESSADIKISNNKYSVEYVKISGNEVIPPCAENEKMQAFCYTDSDEAYVAVTKPSSTNVHEFEILLRKTDKSQNSLWELPMSENTLYVKQLEMQDNNLLVLTDNSLLKYSTNGKLLGKLEMDGSMVQAISSDEEYVYAMMLANSNYVLYRYSADLKEISQTVYHNKFILVPSNKDVFLTDGDILYICKNDAMEAVLSLEECYTNGDLLSSVTCTADGYSLIIRNQKGELSEQIIFRDSSLSPDDSSQSAALSDSVKQPEPAESSETAAEREPLSIASLNEGGFRSAIVWFNKSQSLYVLAEKKYGGDNREEQISASLISDDSPDIVEISCGYSPETYCNYVQKGYLADFSDFLADSNLLPADSILDFVIDDFTTESGIYGLPKGFDIYTLACPTKVLNGKTSWNIEDFLTFMESYPNAYIKNGMSVTVAKQGILEATLQLGITRFVNYENKMASFDSEEFREILERINNLNIQEINLSNEERLSNGEILLRQIHLFKTRNLQEAEWENNQGESLTLIGYPSGTDAPSGALRGYSSLLGITSKTQHIDGAWKFVESNLAAALDNNSYYFPIGKTGLENKLAEEMDIEEIILDGVPYPPITQEQSDKVRLAIEGSYFSQQINREFLAIIREECEYYFAGMKSLDETTQIIQSRIQLHLDETN